MKCLVTGGAGFIGSNLVERLLQDGHEVTVIDNLSSGKLEFTKPFEGNEGYRFVKGDLLDGNLLKETMDGSEVIFHIGANPDIRLAEHTTEADLKNGIIATYNVLESMKTLGIKKIVFSSRLHSLSVSRVSPTQLSRAEQCA